LRKASEIALANRRISVKIEATDNETIIECSSLDHSNGTILLIHGSPPFNADRHLILENPSSEIFLSGYALEDGARYSNLGVSSMAVDFNTHRRTNYDCISRQFRQTTKKGLRKLI